MDRLLRVALERFDPRGESAGHHRGRDRPLRSATAPARRWRSASPRGPPNAASCSIPSSSSAKPTWTAASWSSRARSPTSSPSCSASAAAARRRSGRGRNGCSAISIAACSNSIRVGARGATSRITTISTASSMRCSSMPTGNTAAPISRPPDQSLDDAQLAKKRHLAAKLLVDAGPARARHRLRLGRACALSRRALRRARHRHHAVARSSLRSRACAPPKRDCPTRSTFRLQDYRDVAGEIRPHRLGRHVRACRRRLLRRVLPQVRRTARRRRRDAAAFDRPLRRPQRHQSLDREIHLPRRLHPGAVGGAAGGRARGPARHRHRDPAPALCRDAQGLARALPRPPRGRSSGSTTRASCGCGNSIWRPPRWRSASRR